MTSRFLSKVDIAYWAALIDRLPTYWRVALLFIGVFLLIFGLRFFREISALSFGFLGFLLGALLGRFMYIHIAIPGLPVALLSTWGAWRFQRFQRFTVTLTAATFLGFSLTALFAPLVGDSRAILWVFLGTWLSFSGAALLAPRFIHTFSAAVVGIILVLLPALALSNLYKMVFSPASTLHSGLLATLVGAVILVISFILQVHFAPEDESAEHEGGGDVA